jgi:hypothetical protein
MHAQRRSASETSEDRLPIDDRERAPRRGRERALGSLLFIGFFLLYVAVSRHTFVSYDGASMAAVAQNIVNHFTVRTTGAFDDYLHLSTPYSPYGIGESILVVPMYALSKAVGHQQFLISLVNPLVVAVNGVVVYRIGRVLGWSSLSAWLAAASFGTLTMALQSTTELFSEPAVGLCEALIVLGFLRWRQGWRWAPLLIGIASGVVIQFRPDSLITVWIGLLTAAFFVPWAVILARRSLVMLGGPMLAGIALIFWYNELRYGRLFVTSYDGLVFHNPLVLGLEGLLVSPGRSLFIYNPIALLGLVGFAVLLWRDRAMAALALTLIVPRIIFFAKLNSWAGGVTWGPRFLMPVVFLFVLAAVEVLRQTNRVPRLRVLACASFAVLAICSVGVNFLSVRVPYEQWRSVLFSPSERAVFENGHPLLRHPNAVNAVNDSLLFVVRASPIHGDVLLLEKGRAQMAPASWRGKDQYIGWLLLAASGAALALGLVLAIPVNGQEPVEAGVRARDLISS